MTGRGVRVSFRALGNRAVFGVCLAGAVSAAAALTTGAAHASPRPDIKPAVVEVTAFAAPPDPTVPWQVAAVAPQTGSGVIIDGHRVLTAAHVVADSTRVTVKRYGTARSAGARVAFVCTQCDLALLTVEDPKFFADVPAVEIGAVPQPGDRVTVYGFPIGGKSLSVTAGIFSRMDVGAPDNPDDEVLVAQIDAAINEGNSGGPITADGKLVGIARSYLENAQNVGYIVPVPVIRHFLKDVEDGRVDGIPELGLKWQVIDNKALRKAVGLTDNETGGLVTRIDYGSTAGDALEPGDVVLDIDGMSVEQDLTHNFPDVGRVDARYAATRKQVGEKLEIRLLRDGERVSRSAVLRNLAPLVPVAAEAVRSYYIYGGLVFQPLTREYVEAYQQLPNDLTAYAHERNVRTPERMQVIIIGSVLPSPVNRGYEELADEVVASVNGAAPRDMRELSRMLDTAPGPHVEIVTEHGNRIVLDVEQARTTGSKILKKHGVPRDRSSDLADVPSGKNR
jgi:S1-C subfamily serine protease